MAAIHINDNQFQEMLRGDKPVLVDYWAPWCGYCRRIGPAVERLAERYGDSLIAAKVNIDEEPALAEKEKIEVIPTLVIYRDGKEVSSIVAPESQAVIENFIRQSLGV